MKNFFFCLQKQAQEHEQDHMRATFVLFIYVCIYVLPLWEVVVSSLSMTAHTTFNITKCNSQYYIQLSNALNNNYSQCKISHSVLSKKKERKQPWCHWSEVQFWAHVDNQCSKQEQMIIF